MKKFVVFDFDGVIADSKDLYTDTIYNSLIEHSLIYPKGRIARALGPKLDITLKNINHFSKNNIKVLKNGINSNIVRRAKSLKLCPYAKQTLKRLKKQKCTLVILTNSSKKFLFAFLKYNKIMKYFDKFFYAENFSDKPSKIKELAKKYKINVKNIIYVADRTKDVKIARKAGCKIIIVLACSWDKNEFHGEKYTIKSLKDIRIL